MRSDRQLVATHGNELRLSEPFSTSGEDGAAEGGEGGSVSWSWAGVRSSESASTTIRRTPLATIDAAPAEATRDRSHP
jgi:hypothetical protein